MVPDPAPHTARDRDLRAITRDGAAFSVMVGMGEAYVPAFALAVGLGDLVAGLISTLPMLAGSILQLVTPWAVRHLGSYRRWVVFCACTQALAFAPLVAGAAWGHVSLGWLAAATVAYWAAGMAAGPAWNAWVSSLVPGPIRPAFFAHRTRVAQASLLAGLLAGGAALELGRRHQVELAAYAGIFAVAMAARLLSSRYLASQSEMPGLPHRHPALGPRDIWRKLEAADSLRVLAYLVVMQAATHVAAPFFTPFLLGPLALSYGEFMVVTAAAFAARVAVLPLLGRIAERRGTRPLLWFGGLGIAPLPLLWMVSDAFAYLLAVQLVAGAAWAAVELATTLAFFEGIEDGDRASVLSAFNLFNATAIAAGSLVGAQLYLHFEAWAASYPAVFLVSASARLLSAGLLRRTPTTEGDHVPRGLRLRTLAVRASGASVQRPILASAAEPAEPANEDAAHPLPGGGVEESR